MALPSKAQLKQQFLSSFEPPDRQDNFHIQLFRAMKKADDEMLAGFEAGFPEHFQIFIGWKRFGADYSHSELLFT